MKKLMIAIIILIALYCAYWFGLAWKIEQGLEEFMTAPDSQMTITGGPYEISGFPLSFKTPPSPIEVTGDDFYASDPQDFTTPKQPYRIQFDKAQARASAFNPMTISLVQSGGAQFDYPANQFGGARYGFDAKAGRLNVTFRPAKGGGFKALSVDGRDITLFALSGPAIAPNVTILPPLKSVEVLDFTYKGGQSYDLTLEGAQIDDAILGPFSAILSPRISRASGTLSGSAIGQASGQFDLLTAGNTLRSDNIILRWGDVDMAADFALSGGPRGASGAANLRVKDPQKLIDTLINQGLIPAQTRMMSRAMLSAAKVDDQGLTVITLSAKDGQWSWGLIPIWPPAF